MQSTASAADTQGRSGVTPPLCILDTKARVISQSRAIEHKSQDKFSVLSGSKFCVCTTNLRGVAMWYRE